MNDNQYFQGLSPAGQIASAIATPLSQVLGGYLGSKLEEDKMRREVESNRAVLRASFPGLPPDQLNQLSRVSPTQLQTVIGGLQSRGLKNVMNAGAGLQSTQPMQPMQPMPSMLQQPIQQESLQPYQPQQEQMQDMTPQEPSIQLPSLDDMSRGGYTQRQVIMAGNQKAKKLNDMQEAANAENLSPEQRMQVATYIAGERKQLVSMMQGEDRLRILERDKAVKRAIEAEDLAFKKEQYYASRSDKEREYLQSEDARLDKKFGEKYRKDLESEAAIRAQLGIANSMEIVNEDPDSNFGHPMYTSLAGGYLSKVTGDQTAFLGTANELTNKMAANLVISRVGELAGKGAGQIRSVLIEEIKKGTANIYQTPRARGYMIKIAQADAKESLRRIKIARDLYEENGGFVDGFDTIVSKRMQPYYKKYKKMRIDALKNIADIAVKQQKKFHKKNPIGAGIRGVKSAAGSIKSAAGSISSTGEGIARSTGDFLLNTLGLKEGLSNIGSILSSGASGLGSVLSAGGEYLANRQIPPLSQKLLFSE